MTFENCINLRIEKTMFKLSMLLLLLVLSGCEENATIEVPAANTLTRDASGYYCLMTVLNHKGPKGQIILSDNKVLWFTSVRDTIAFTQSPEEPKNIAAVYVNDMTNANWDNPGEDNWVEAKDSWFVLNSKRSGGMGAAEAVPFSTKKKAELFVTKEGGGIYSFSEIPKEYLFGK